MIWYDNLSLLPSFPRPIFLTIGNFDGVHRGHQLVLSTLASEAGRAKGSSIVLTFANHPAAAFGRPAPLLLCSLSQKKNLIRAAGCSIGIAIPFTRDFSRQSAEEFLIRLRGSIPFSKMILGYDAVFGRQKSGTREVVQEIAVELDFQVEYLPAILFKGQPISSSGIRSLIQQGRLDEAQECLGRPFSFAGLVVRGKGLGKLFGYPTANLSLEGLCLPPLGVYCVRCVVGCHSYPGVANIGVAPTMRRNSPPLLEVHLLDFHENVYDAAVEVILDKFLRPEMLFSSREALFTQIEADAAEAKKFYD